MTSVVVSVETGEVMRWGELMTSSVCGERGEWAAVAVEGETPLSDTFRNAHAHKLIMVYGLIYRLVFISLWQRFKLKILDLIHRVDIY